MFQRTLAILILALSPVLAHAQTAGEKQPAQPPPALVVRLAPLDSLLDDIKLVGSMLGKDDFTKPLDDAIKSKLGPKGLFGIDGKRPIGLYARIGKDISDISAVLMVPIHSDKEFKKMLEAMEWKVTAEEGGLHTVKQDLVPMDVTYRVAHKYAYIGIMGQQEELLKPANLLAPDKVFKGKQAASIALSLRIDQIPADARDAMLQGIKEMVGGAKKGGDAFGDSLQKEMERLFTDVLTQGEELTALIDIERDTKKLVAELALKPKAGTELAKSFKSMGQRKTLFAGVLHKDAAMNALVNIEMPQGLRAAFDGVVKDAMKKVLDDTKDETKRKQAAKLLDALKPSLTSGDIDAAFSLRGPHKDKTFTMVAGVKLQDGDKLMGAVIELLKELPPEELKDLKLNADKVGSVAIHRFDLEKVIEGKGKEFVGDHPLYFAFRDDALFLAMGQGGLGLLKQAIMTDAAVALPAQIDLSLTRMAGLMDKAAGAGLGQKAGALSKKGDDARVALTIEGGAELRVRFTMSLSLFSFLEKQ